MLVLGLKLGEFVTLQGLSDKPFAVQIVELRGDQIRLGFVGPLEVNVVRGEVVARDTKQTAQEVLQKIIMENKRGPKHR
jgi:sRNA-binding carbon storage regulator CsrA